MKIEEFQASLTRPDDAVSAALRPLQQRDAVQAYMAENSIVWILWDG